MSITAIRFRTEGKLVVLQVCDQIKDRYSYQSIAEWRDGTVEDLLEVAAIIDKKHDEVPKYEATA